MQYFSASLAFLSLLSACIDPDVSSTKHTSRGSTSFSSNDVFGVTSSRK